MMEQFETEASLVLTLLALNVKHILKWNPKLYTMHNYTMNTVKLSKMQRQILVNIIHYSQVSSIFLNKRRYSNQMSKVKKGTVLKKTETNTGICFLYYVFNSLLFV